MKCDTCAWDCYAGLCVCSLNQKVTEATVAFFDSLGLIRHRIVRRSDGVVVASGQTDAAALDQVRNELRTTMNDEYVVEVAD